MGNPLKLLHRFIRHKAVFWILLIIGASSVVIIDTYRRQAA